jgi:AraC family transcriptional regulator
MSLALSNAPREMVMGPFTSVEPAGDVVTLATQGAWLRHQQLGAFSFAYDGEHPLVLFLFNMERSARGRDHARGSFTLLQPGMTASFNPPEPMEVLAVAFDGPAVAPSMGIVPSDPPACAVDAGVRALSYEIRRVLLREGEAAADYLASLAHSLFIRASQVVRLPTKAPPRETLAPLNLRRVADHIERRLSDRITVRELAAIAGLSRAHFSRAFLNATGAPPHGFIQSRRLALVRRRLEEGAEDLSQLAAQAGFSSHSHMTTAFRQAFGITPREHRHSQAVSPAPLQLAAAN